MGDHAQTPFRRRAAALALGVLAALLLMPAAADAKRRIFVPATVKPGVAFTVKTTGWHRGARVRLYVAEFLTDNISAVGLRTVKRGRAKFGVKLSRKLDVNRDWVVMACERKRCDGGRRVTRRLKVAGQRRGSMTPPKPTTPKQPAPKPATPNPARGGVVDPSTGLIGTGSGLKIDQSTPPEVAGLLGAPERTSDVSGGQVYGYACEATRCATEFTFNALTGALSDFATSEPSYRTPAGSAPGMAATKAAELEEQTFETTCREGIMIPGPATWAYLTKQGDAVDEIWLSSITNSIKSC